jgi:hypothetical protein
MPDRVIIYQMAAAQVSVALVKEASERRCRYQHATRRQAYLAVGKVAEGLGGVLGLRFVVGLFGIRPSFAHQQASAPAAALQCNSSVVVVVRRYVPKLFVS